MTELFCLLSGLAWGCYFAWYFRERAKLAEKSAAGWRDLYEREKKRRDEFDSFMRGLPAEMVGVKDEWTQ